MEVLSFSRRLWEITGVINRADDEQRRLRVREFFANFLIISILVLFIWLSVTFLIYEQWNGDGAIFMTVLLQVTASVSGLFPYLWMILCSKRLKGLVGSLELIVGKRMPLNEEIYKNAERKSTLLAKWPAFLCGSVYIALFTCATIVCLVIDLLRNNIDTLGWFNIHIFRQYKHIIFWNRKKTIFHYSELHTIETLFWEQ